MDHTRRGFIQGTAAASLAASLFPASIGEALALPARRVTGTLKDVEHVVILMQENRSFDHYFGSLRGVRGFDDPRPTLRPDGRPIWQQSAEPGADAAMVPFHLDTANSAANCIDSLDHSWKGSNDRWKHHDVWLPEKSLMCMGHLTRADIPYYHALADAFTLCDAYHCSIHGPTGPNRLYLFSGSNGLSAGHVGGYNITNEDDGNYTADSAKDVPTFAGYAWTTYAERLQDAGIAWKIYQEYDNFGDNSLGYFARYRGLDKDDPLYRRGRAWVDGSTAENAEASRGEHLVRTFAADVAADRLPAVSWIVAPYIMSEHPKAPPAYGEVLISQLIAALVANPGVWAKTVFILNYDENDGFFDHMPPPVPAIDAAMGGSTVDVRGEIYDSQPVGLGPRVPMLLISPWSRGGWVNSQLFDHTSVIRFLEERFGVREPNISPWRRAMMGDLTSAFDFARPDEGRVSPLPDTGGNLARSDAACKLPAPAPPPVSVPPRTMPRQETGGRPARPLPYALEVRARRDGDGLRLEYHNIGTAGAVFTTRTLSVERAGPWSHSVEPGKALSHHWPLAAEQEYVLLVYGPNGFLREFHGRRDALPGVEVDARPDGDREALILTLRNAGSAPVGLTLRPRDYDTTPARAILLPPGTAREEVWPVARSDRWYDLEISGPDAAGFRRRYAGHVENGLPGVSDPALGRPA